MFLAGSPLPNILSTIGEDADAITLKDLPSAIRANQLRPIGKRESHNAFGFSSEPGPVQHSTVWPSELPLAFLHILRESSCVARPISVQYHAQPVLLALPPFAAIYFTRLGPDCSFAGRHSTKELAGIATFVGV